MKATKEQQERSRRKRREALDRMKLERGCADCGYNVHPAALHWDHVVEREKHPQAKRSAFHPNWSMERILAVIADCEVVCANCHAVRTAARGYKGGRPMHRATSTT